MEVVIEGSAYAEFRNSEYTEQCDVKKAISEKRKRINFQRNTIKYLE
ncbi:Lon-insertion domain-containing protein [Clostridioides difficile]